MDLDLEDLKNRQRDEIRALLIEHSRRFAEKTVDPQGEVETRLKQVFDGQTLSPKALHAALEDGRLKGLSDWLNQDLNYPLSPEAMTRLNPEILKNFMASAVEAKYRPEMQKLERALLLNLLDSAWKDHLLVMDHLRNSVGLRGYAQVDPKVEYKREGMRTFEQMWDTVGERTTDLIFRMEQLDEGFVGSTWTGAEARHDAAAPPSDIGAAAAVGHRRHAERRQAQADPQPGRNGSAATIPAPAAAGRSSRIATCGRRRDKGRRMIEVGKGLPRALSAQYLLPAPAPGRFALAGLVGHPHGQVSRRLCRETARPGRRGGHRTRSASGCMP